MRPDCSFDSFYTTGIQKKIDCFSADGFSGHCNKVFKAISCFHYYRPCQEARPALTEEDFQGGTKNRETDKIQEQYFEKESYTVAEMWECGW